MELPSLPYTGCLLLLAHVRNRISLVLWVLGYSSSFWINLTFLDSHRRDQEPHTRGNCCSLRRCNSTNRWHCCCACRSNVRSPRHQRWEVFCFLRWSPGIRQGLIHLLTLVYYLLDIIHWQHASHFIDSPKLPLFRTIHFANVRGIHCVYHKAASKCFKRIKAFRSTFGCHI